MGLFGSSKCPPTEVVRPHSQKQLAAGSGDTPFHFREGAENAFFMPFS